jgi:DNA-binding transcriptional MerR regulator
MKLLKIGEIAKRAGVSVRTLHHYDQIGLLCPSDSSESGHRLYNAADVERLQHIASLKSMGFSLEGISRCLEDKNSTLLRTFEMQEEVVSQQLETLKSVHGQLRAMLQKLRHRENLSTNELLELMKEMKIMESWKNQYTSEQIKSLQDRYQKYPEQVKEVEKAWPILFKQFEDAMKKGLDPASSEVQELAQKAQHFIDLFTGGDKAIEANLNKGYQQNQEGALKVWGVSREVFEYASKARTILNR